MGDLIQQSDLEARLGADVVRRIYDDGNVGSANAASVARLITDSEARVKASVRRGHSQADYLLVIAQKPDLLVTLTLDVAQGYAWQRFPSYVRCDGAAILKTAMEELDRVALGKLRFDITSAIPTPTNEGGTVRSGNPLLPTPKPKLFTDGTGDF